MINGLFDTKMRCHSIWKVKLTSDGTLVCLNIYDHDPCHSTNRNIVTFTTCLGKREHKNSIECTE